MATSEQAFVDEFNYDISDLLSEKNINDFYLTPKSQTPNGIYENIFFIRVTYFICYYFCFRTKKNIYTEFKKTDTNREVCEAAVLVSVTFG